MQLQAGSLSSRIGSTTTASGDVVVRQGARQLRSAELIIDEEAGVARSGSAAWLSDEGVEVRGQSAVFGLLEPTARLADAEFVLTKLQLRGHAADLQRNEDALRLGDVWLTRCPPNSRSWRLRAAELRVDDGDAFASARHVRVDVGSVPVFYAPYLRFPTGRQRMSGFLFPSLSSSDGFDFALPYYWNLAPNYDATLTPRWIGRRGAGVAAELRHLGRSQDSVLNVALLPQDDDFDGERSRQDFLAAGGTSANFAPAHRWLLDVDHQGRWGALRTLLDVEAVSDSDYFIDLGSDVGVGNRALLERRAELRYDRQRLTSRLWLQSFQRLEPGLAPYRRLPEASLSYGGALWGPVEWSFDGAWSAFRRDASALATGIDAMTGERLHLEPRVRLPLERAWGRLALSAALRHTRYALRRTPDFVDERPKRQVLLASVDGGLFFERDAGRWLHTLEPRLRYLYQGFAEQGELPRFDAARPTPSYPQLFRDNRFAGLDRLGDANQLSMGVVSRLLDDASGAERLSAAVGAIAYFDHRRVVLRGVAGDEERQRISALASEVRGTLGRLGLDLNLTWDPNGDDVDAAALGLSYRPDRQRIVNLSFRRRRLNDSRQTDLSWHWPLARRWSLFGRWNYDWNAGQGIDSFAGFGYSSCCVGLKLLWHDAIETPAQRPTPSPRRDRGVLLQIEFRGLAGFGSKVESRLQRGIKGYRAEAG